MALTWPLCPANLKGRCVGSKLHIYTRLSFEADATCLIKGSRATELISFVWPRNDLCSSGSDLSF